MADTESLGDAGVRFLEGLAAAPDTARRVRVPAITDPRGIDFAVYKRLGQSEAMAGLEKRTIAALSAFGVLMFNFGPVYRFGKVMAHRQCWEVHQERQRFHD